MLSEKQINSEVLWYDLYRRGQRLIVRLLFFTINRGALFSVIQIGRMVSFLVAPQTNFWYAH